MKLTPLDIHHKEFRNALRGYNPEEVDDFLDGVADEFERLFKENIDLSEKLEAAGARVRAYSDMERTLQNTMVAAQTSADDIRARAEAEAARLLSEAESKAQEIVGTALEEKQRSQVETARMKAAEEEFRARFRLMLQDYLVAVEEPAREADDETAAFAAPAPVAAPEPEPVVEPLSEPGKAEDAPSGESPVESDPEASGTVVGLMMGELEPPTLEEPDVPTFEDLDDFILPPRGPVGERDEESDIEEID
jgi:cell division initiation protein